MKHLRKKKRRQAKTPQPVSQLPPVEEGRWDEVDEASWESFPASDAPATWAGPDLPPRLRARQTRPRAEPAEPPTRPT